MSHPGKILSRSAGTETRGPPSHQHQMQGLKFERIFSLLYTGLHRPRLSSLQTAI